MRLQKGILYIVLSFTLWPIVEYATVWHSRFSEWVSLMPYVFIQYLVIVLIFWYFIFRRMWSERRILIVMIVVMYAFEFLWQNPLLLNLYLFMPASILLVSIWGFLIFIPFWVVERSLSQHKLQAAFCSLWTPIAVALGFLTNLG
ncbi:MAG: hypothetical protein ACE5HJ_04735 [Thermoplasmata archaeon]